MGGLVRAEPRVADHDVETPELVHGRADKSLHVFFTSDISHHRKRTPLERFDLAHDRDQPILAAGGDDDRRSVAGDAERGRAADAGGRPRDRDNGRESRY
jgi:hypothetical protein